MAVNKATLIALIRAARPNLKTRADRLAYAVHAYLLAQGYKCVAVGKRADEAAPEEELTKGVSDEGWNEMDGVYAFRYLPEDGRKEGGLQVKMEALGPKLLVHWAPAGASGQAPKTLELPIDKYTNPEAEVDDPAEAYVNLEQLLRTLDEHFHVALPSVTKSSATAAAGGVKTAAAAGGGLETSAGAGTGGGGGGRPQGARAAAGLSPDPLADDPNAAADGRLPPPRPDVDPNEMDPDPLGGVRAPWEGGPGFSGAPRAPPGWTPGADDVVPPGLRAPGTSGGYGIPHIPPGPGMEPPGFGLPGTGGMHVGPGSPLYGGVGGRGGASGGPYGGVGGVGRPPPGSRFDPIAPQGLPGWNPGDFQRGGGSGGRRGTHPDIQPPGPGRGADFDSMFG